MFIMDRYLLTASHTFELKDMQEITVNIELTKVPPCYNTSLTGRVLCKNMPIEKAVVKVFDCNYKPMFHAVTNKAGVYHFTNILAPGKYKIVVAADGYHTSITRNVNIKSNKPIEESFQLVKCKTCTMGILYGIIKDKISNKPVVGACVYLKGKSGLVYRTTTNKDGQYIIYNICSQRYTLIVKKHGYDSSKPIRVAVEDNDRINLVIYLRKQNSCFNKTISGIVTYEGKPVSSSPVFLYIIDKDNKETLVKIQTTNSEGVFLFSGLAEGNYMIKGIQQY